MVKKIMTFFFFLPNPATDFLGRVALTVILFQCGKAGKRKGEQHRLGGWYVNTQGRVAL